MPTLLERVTPVLKESRRVVCLAALMFVSEDRAQGVTASELKQALIDARVPDAKKFNVADVLGKAGSLVTAKNGGRSLAWSLTQSGREFVGGFVELGDQAIATKNSVQGLTNVSAFVKDDVVRSYIAEAILCLQVDARRAAVVFLWSGAMRTLQESAWTFGAQQVNAALLLHDPKVKALKKIEDFSAVKDVTQLLGYRELGLVDKGQWQTLQEGLDLRNRCGHPTKYHPGVAKVSAFVEDLVGIVF